MAMRDWLSIFELYSQDSVDTIRVIDTPPFTMKGHKMVHKETGEAIYWISYSLGEYTPKNGVLLMFYFFPEKDYKEIRPRLERGEHPADVLAPYGKLPIYVVDDLSGIYSSSHVA